MAVGGRMGARACCVLTKLVTSLRDMLRGTREGPADMLRCALRPLLSPLHSHSIQLMSSRSSSACPIAAPCTN